MLPRHGMWLAVFGLALTARSAAGAERLRLVVVDLKQEDPASQSGAMFAELIASETGRLGLYEVISYAELRQLIQLETDRQSIGCEDEATCVTELGGALGVDRMVSGTVRTIPANESTPPQTMLSLALTDPSTATVLSRVVRQGAVRTIVDQMDVIVRELLQPDLGNATVPVIFEVSEPGAEVHVNDRLLGISPLSRQELTVGRHAVRVSKASFVDFASEIDVLPEQPKKLTIDLFPSPEFAEDHRRTAAWMRGAAWGGTALAVVGGALALGFGVAYSNDVARYDELDRQRLADPQLVQMTREAYSAQYDQVIGDIDRDRALIYTGVITAALGAGTAAILWLVGDDPDRYASYTESF